MGLRRRRRVRRARLLERPRRGRARGGRRRGVQRILRFADGHRPRLQSGRPPADVRRRALARRRRLRVRVRRRRVSHDSRRLADPRLRAPGRGGGDLLRGAADPLGLPGPGRARDRPVVWPVDGAGQPLPAHEGADGGRVVRVAGAGIPDHGARRRQRDSRLSPGQARRQAQPRRAPRSPARRPALSRARGGGLAGGRRRRGRGRLPPGLPRRAAGAAAARRERPLRGAHATNRRANSSPPCAASCPATWWRCCCSLPGSCGRPSDELHRSPAGAAVRLVADHPRLRPVLPPLLHRIRARQEAPGRARRERGDARWPARSSAAACRM